MSHNSKNVVDGNEKKAATTIFAYFVFLSVANVFPSFVIAVVCFAVCSLQGCLVNLLSALPAKK